MNIYLMLDTTEKKCDKKWLFEELKKLHKNTYAVRPAVSTNDVQYSNRLTWQIFSKSLIIGMCVKTCLRAKKEDVIICWLPMMGLLCNLINRILRRKRIVMSLNWLSPNIPKIKGKAWVKNWYKACFEDENTLIGMNSVENISLWLDTLETKGKAHIFHNPDTLENDIDFEKRRLLSGEKRYCFTGGVNNRDWALLVAAAKQLPNIDFKCIALKLNWEGEVKTTSVPDNLTVEFETPPSHYYDLMQSAYLLVLPLKDTRVAGIINILKAAQYGILPLVTRTDALEQYIPDDQKEMLLFDHGNKDDFCNKLNDLMNLNEVEYDKTVLKFQKHIAENFSHKNGAQRIKKALESIGVQFEN